MGRGGWEWGGAAAACIQAYSHAPQARLDKTGPPGRGMRRRPIKPTLTDLRDQARILCGHDQASGHRYSLHFRHVEAMNEVLLSRSNPSDGAGAGRSWLVSQGSPSKASMLRMAPNGDIETVSQVWCRCIPASHACRRPLPAQAGA